MTADQYTFYFQDHDSYVWPCSNPGGEDQVKVVCGQARNNNDLPATCACEAWCEPPVELKGFQVGKTKLC